jgi:predicted unusual protein kinase regulating ubiquinone biosynthesis (AarF/ABC1/UbiB family)
VVVKVQRPDIQEIVDTDLAALRVVSGWVHRYPPIRRRINVPALMEEFSRSLYEEMDYLAEGKNGETFAANFTARPEVRVPRIYWSHTTRRVLTMEDVSAIKINDYGAITVAGIDRAEVANRLFDTYLQQIFEDRFFHADPHPGNLFVLPDPAQAGELGEAGWQLIFVDFGMTGQVQPRMLEGLREILIAVGTRDVPRMVRAYQTMEILLPGADLELIEKAGQRVFDRFWGKSTTEIVSMGHQEAMDFAREFGDLLYEMPFQVPENLILLGRSVSILSGICSGLNTDFNVWERVMPYANRLVSADQQGQNIWLREGLNILQSLVALPRRTEAVLQRLESGRLEVQYPELRGQFQKLDGALRRLSGAILFAALFLGAVQFSLADQTTLAWGSLVAAVVALLWMLLG